ncbi:MAG: ferredoxin reductase family protein [Leptospira sp.]|nr:ferredoxin reductase family protein [Leptospira sp.]
MEHSINMIPFFTSYFWNGVSFAFACFGMLLLSLSILLILKSPKLAVWIGSLEKMNLWHHRFATIGYAFILLHPLILGWEGFFKNQSNAWIQISPWENSSFVGLGWISIVLFMIGLFFTFNVQLPYRLWKYSHVILSVAFLLGIYHVFIVKGFLSVYSLMVFPPILVLFLRLFSFDHKYISIPFIVETLKYSSSEIVEIELKPMKQKLQVSPGQYIFVAFYEGPGFKGCGEFHPFSIIQSLKNGNLMLAVKSLGECTKNILKLQTGVRTNVIGPFGDFHSGKSTKNEIWIAAGVGVTPFLSLINKSRIIFLTKMYLLLNEKKDSPFVNAFENFSLQNSNFQFELIETKKNLKPLFHDLEKIIGLKEMDFFICGPPLMMNQLFLWLYSKGVSHQSIHYEQFDLRL